MEGNPGVVGSTDKASCKGMLADLLEREVKKEPVNGATTLPSKELRISDNGLELIPNENRGHFAVDMGVVGMNDLGVDLGDGVAVPKAAHLIAQVDDSGHVQIHLEEEVGSTVCNGQSLLDQLEACEVSSSTDQVQANLASKGIKRLADAPEKADIPATKKTVLNHVSSKLNEYGGGISEKTVEAPLIEQNLTDKNKEKLINGGINGAFETSNAFPSVLKVASTVASTVVPTVISTIASTTVSTVVSTAVSTVASAVTHHIQSSPQSAVLGPNTPRTFLILQQQTPQQARIGFPQQGQRLLLAIQRPGGVIQHVAMPTNMVAISSSQLQTNGTVVTLTSSGGTSNGATVHRDFNSNPNQALSSSCLPVSSTVLSTSAQPITTVASTVSGVVTTASMEGVVTFSGGAVAFPARPTESTSRTSNLAESHVTITPVSASSIVNPCSINSSPSICTSPTGAAGLSINTQPTATLSANAGNKKRNNSSDTTKPRSRPVKTKSSDQQPASSPVPVDTSLQYLCEWKDCMRYDKFNSFKTQIRSLTVRYLIVFRSFKTPHEVYVHACQVHCPAHIDELGCQWERCDGLKRRRFSMMTHLMDRHCNDEVRHHRCSVC